MNLIAGIAARRLAAIALSFAISTAIPYMLQDKPKLKWVWSHLGPVVVDAADTATNNLLVDSK